MQLLEFRCVRNKECKRCERYRQATNVCVPGEVVGDGQVQLIVVGEAPGKEEDIKDRPFVGPSGKLLRELLERANVTYYLTNAIKCYGDTPGLREVQACSIYLQEELNSYPGLPVLAVGMVAARALGYKDARMQAIVNTVAYSSSLKRKIGFIVHPAAYLRAPMKLKKIWDRAEITIANLLEEKPRDLTQEYKIVMNTLPATVPQVWSLDTETTGLDMFGVPEHKQAIDPKCSEPRAVLTAIAIYVADTGTVYVLNDPRVISQSIPVLLKWWAKNPPFVHNAKFDLHMLQQEAIRLKYSVPFIIYPIRDTMVHLAINNPDAPKGLARNLEALNIQKYWGDTEKYKVADLTAYVAADSYAVYVLREAHKDAENHPEYDFLQRLTAATQLIERVGIPVSTAHAQCGLASCRSAIEEILHESGLSEDTLRSPMRMARLLDQDTTNKESLVSLIAREPESPKARIAQYLLAYRKHLKLIGYYQSILALQTQNEFGWDVVHAQLNPVGAAGGRMSSSSFSPKFGLNLQNFPPEAKHVFQPPSQFVLLEADYSQIELRVVAQIAQVRAMLDAFEKNEDLHSRTAVVVFGEVTPELRRKAKAVNFGFLYGMSAEGFQQYLLGNFGMEISVEEAKAIRSKFFASYPELTHYYKTIEREVIQHGYVESLFGRRRYFVPVPEQIRAAINFKVQSTAAEICLRAMITLTETLPGLGGYVVNQVHDAIYFVLPEDKLDILLDLITRTMQNTQLGVFPVETKVTRYTPATGVGPPRGALSLFDEP